MNIERLKEVENKKLKSGSGTTIESACIMELTAYVAGEKWSDHPECTCPILTEYAIRINDVFNDEHRQKLKPFIPLLIGTRLTPEIQIKRKQLMMWRNVTALYPELLGLFKMPELANQLRALKNNIDDMAIAAKLLKENKEEIQKNAYAYANANALRERLSNIAIETLRMAIEVKE